MNSSLTFLDLLFRIILKSQHRMQLILFIFKVKPDILYRDLVIKQESGRSSVQLKHVDLTDDGMSELIWKRFHSTSMNVSAKDNFYYSLLISGLRSKVLPTPNYLLPPYLTFDGFSNLKVIYQLLLYIQ